MWLRMSKAKAAARLERAFATGDFASTISAYEKLIARHPNDHELYNDLGVALLESGELGRSLAAIGTAIELHENCVHWNNLGRLYVAQKKFDDARRAFGRARELDSRDPQPWFNTIVSLREEGRGAESVEELRRFVQTFPHHVNGQVELGAHYMDDRPEHAAACFERALEGDPCCLPARLNLVRLLCDLGRYPESTPHLEAAAAQTGATVKVDVEDGKIIIDLDGKRFYEGELRE